MLRATQIAPAGSWPEPPADVVRLDYDRRTRRRLALVGRGGLAFLLDLAKAPVLAAGDGLRLEDGRIVAVEAAAECLLEVTARDQRALARLAWHLGNRHLACEIAQGALYIRHDHVIAGMLAGLGAGVRVVERPFDPEGGAYAEAREPGREPAPGEPDHRHGAHDHPHAGGQ